MRSPNSSLTANEPRSEDEVLDLDRTSLAPRIEKILRRWIAEGRLKPGEKINPNRLAKRFNVSRTPVKEALNQLRDDGLVVIQPQSGTFVSELSRERIADSYEARLMFESWGMQQLSQKRPPEVLKRMQDLIDQAGELFSAPADFDFETFMELDRRLHGTIVESTGNAMISKLFRSVDPHVHITRVYWSNALGPAQKAHEEHVGIVKAMTEGDWEAAQSRLRAHIIGSEKDMLERLEETEAFGAGGGGGRGAR